MGGDEDNQGTPTLAWTVNLDSLYTKSQPLEWYVEENGGAIGRPITEDMQVEQTVFAVADQPPPSTPIAITTSSSTTAEVLPGPVRQ